MSKTVNLSVAPGPQATAELQQYLTFLLGGEMFAIGILNIREIIEYGNLTEVPMMPSFIRGVINLRGSVVPVIDLSARFGKDATTVSRRTCVVIVEVDVGAADNVRQHVGVMVDSVSAVLDIPADEIEPPPTFGSRIRADFISGMGKVEGKFVIILNIDKALSEDEIATISAIGESGQAQSTLAISAPGTNHSLNA